MIKKSKLCKSNKNGAKRAEKQGAKGGKNISEMEEKAQIP